MKTDISGFPEFLPNEQIVFDRFRDIVKKQFESYGFIPMDTPAVERIDTLLAKGNDSEIYGIYRLADEGSKKNLGLRFDLTVPFARYVAAYHGEMTFPHRRYQIAPVWRGERPQAGRYRQFYQCDIDVIAENELTIEHDAEVIMILIRTLNKMEVPAFTMRVNNRKVLSGFLKYIIGGEEDDEKARKVLECIRIIDKREKIPEEEFWREIKQFEISDRGIEKLREFLAVTEEKGNERECYSSKITNFEVIKVLKGMEAAEQSPEFSRGVDELESTLRFLASTGFPVDKWIKISTGLARGLAYYTGTVFETTFNDYKDIGSICGGGRYDNLTAMISGNKKNFIGVGASIGISRIVPKLIEKGLISCEEHTLTKVLVSVQDRKFLSEYMRIAERFRDFGLETEVYLQNKSLNAQMSYADRKGIDFVVIANETELMQKEINIRNLKTKEQKKIDLDNGDLDDFASKLLKGRV